MARTRHTSEIGFGSDSFLDIVANIVGILIILIVIAGVRVSRSPLAPQDSPNVGSRAVGAASTPASPPDAASQPAQPSEVAAAADGGNPQHLVENRRAVERRQAELRQAERRAAEQRYARQQAELAKLAADIAEADRRIRQFETDRDTAQARATELKNRLAELNVQRERAADQARQLQAAAERLAAEVEQQTQRVRDLQAAVLRARAERNDLADEFGKLAEAQPPTKTLEHRVNPLSRRVQGPELHVRLLDGRLSVIPIDDLLARLKSDVQSRRNWLMKYRAYEGRVGPVRGYALRYLVERQSLSTLDEIRYGRGFVRVGVSYWELVPQPGLIEETVDEALQPSSTFSQALAAAAPETTLTVWVYPDSFAEFARLQAAAHRSGLEVAARPLPFGIPIAGSPHGTSSAGQ